jgi:CRP-like cAMP-binding protein
MTTTVQGSERPREGISHAELPASTQDTEQNRLLAALPRDSYDRLSEHLEAVEFSPKQTLWKSNEPIRSVYFPRTCVLSLLIMFEEEGPVESATVGREGMVGVALALGADSTASMAIAQVPGEAVRIPAAVFRDALADDAALSSLMLRYAYVQHEQASQSVACNRRHPMDQRCARWILMTHDRVAADQFSLTQQFLAFMLGVRRASVTTAAGILQHAGLIRYSRGRVTVLDRARLEEAACECYRIMRDKSERMFAPEGRRSTPS